MTKECERGAEVEWNAELPLLPHPKPLCSSKTLILADWEGPMEMGSRGGGSLPGHAFGTGFSPSPGSTPGQREMEGRDGCEQPGNQRSALAAAGGWDLESCRLHL